MKYYQDLKSIADKALKASWDNTVADVHPNAEEANVRAVEKLADSALRYVILCLLEETNAGKAHE